MPKKPSITATCPCGATFHPLPSHVAAGNGKYCNKECWRRFVVDNLAERLWARVNKTEGCWLWTGSTNDVGYGQMRVRKRLLYTHRVAWELVNGPIPAGACVLHNCPGGENTLCCRPGHLFLGTKQDNSADMVSKSRQSCGERHSQLTKISVPSGERHYNSRLTADDVREIYASRGLVSNVELGRRFHVSPATVSDIQRGLTWRSVTHAIK